MKKTLLALAVLAASGAAFAQTATITGTLATGYQSTKVGGVTTAGLGVDTAEIFLIATEDLGGGLKATAKLGLGNLTRDAAGVQGRDSALSLAGGFGTVILTTFESDDGLSRAYAGAPVIGLDGKVHAANSNIDLIGYTSPQLAPGLTVGINYVDRGATAASGTGLSQGTTGATGSQPSSTANIAYKAGPIDARFDVTSWTRSGAADVVSSANKNRFRISGNYNLGVATIGLGYAQVKRSTTNIKQTEVGVSAPLGATTVGLVYEQQTVGTVKTSGVTLGAQYNLSKRTNISAGYAQWKTVGAATTDSTFRVLVGHSF